MSLKVLRNSVTDVPASWGCTSSRLLATAEGTFSEVEKTKYSWWFGYWDRSAEISVSFMKI